ncbi:hypothetical protein RF11_03031 [Thelohanellus kitauei]|uniref:Uncharacterized protein n=1 Tax=Thelohanellus kitauei TaxID=669202 RepID=A0A0C2MNL5_THEKT|nr:hypothetical protein RF11_03031 [Thelohanellus kitauei]
MDSKCDVFQVRQSFLVSQSDMTHVCAAQPSLVQEKHLLNIFFHLSTGLSYGTQATLMSSIEVFNVLLSAATPEEGICHELSKNSSTSTNFYFIDDSGFQLKMICLYGRELTKMRATKVVLALRSRDYCVTCTMSCEGMNGLVGQANSKFAEKIFSSIETSNSHITSNDCRGLYRHKESYLPDCIQGNPVEN